MNDPETDTHAVQLGRRIRLSLRSIRYGIRQRAVTIGSEQEDRFDVGRRGAHEGQTIGLRAGVRPLVRPNAAGLVAFRGDRGEDAAPRAPLTRGQREVLREHIQHWLRVAPQHALRAPVGKPFGGEAVAIVVRTAGRRGRRFRQHDVDDILCGERRVPRPLRLIDDVIRRRDQRAEALDGGVPLTPKRRDEVSHELS